MSDKKLHQQTFGLESPWRVTDVVMNQQAQEIVLHVDCHDQVYAWPTCKKRMHVHAHEARKWRHLKQIGTNFVHYHGSAQSEGMNSRIQAMIKRANGYRNRARLANDLYSHFGSLDLYPGTTN